MLYLLFAWVCLLTWALYRVDWNQTCENVTVSGNGFGSLTPILEKTADRSAPSAYRVLVPFMVNCLCGEKKSYGLLPSMERILGFRGNAYMTVKLIGQFLAVAGSTALFYIWTGGHVLLTATMASAFVIFLQFAAVYDYADTYWEIGLWCLSICLLLTRATTLNLGITWYLPAGLMLGCWLVLVGLATLNRWEASLFLPLFALALSAGWLFLMAGLSVWLVVTLLIRWRVGHVKRYCGMNLLPDNLSDCIQGIVEKRLPVLFEPLVYFLALCLCLILSSVLAFSQWSVSDLRVWLMVGACVMFVAASVPGKWQEIRIYSIPVLLIILISADLLRGVL